MKEPMYEVADFLIQFSNEMFEDVIKIKFDLHRKDPSGKYFYEFIDDLIHEGHMKKHVPLNFRRIEDDERLDTIVFDLVRKEPEKLEKYIKNVILRQDLRMMRKFYFDAMDIANDINNYHGTHTKQIEKLEKLFHNTYK